MTEKIKSALAEIALEKDIEILWACETGSRAWGFPSPDSDYDVRIIYRHRLPWYLRLNEGKDSLDIFLENRDIDISGWDLRKCLRLLAKSNPPLLERIQSPIVYQSKNRFQEQFLKLAQQFYSPIASIHHYQGLAKKSLSDLNSDNPYMLKKFFYALRASCACLWILERNDLPPIEFQRLIDGIPISEKLQLRIDTLIEEKALRNEDYLHLGEAELFHFMTAILNRVESEAQNLKARHSKTEVLDKFLFDMIRDDY